MSTATPPPAPSTPATEPSDHRAKRGVGNGAAPAWALALSTLLILLTVLVSAYQLGRNQRANAQDLRDEFRDDLSRVERELTKKVLDLNLDTLKTERAQADRLAQQGAALLELMEQSQGQANRLATWQNAWQRRWAAMQNQLEQIEQQQRAQAQRRQELLQLTQSLQEQQAAIQRALQERSQQTQQRLEGLNTRLERLDQTRQEAERRVQQRAERLAQHEADQAASLRALRADVEQLRQAIADLGRRMGPATEADTSGQAAAEADPTPATQPASTTPPAESADAP
jgi:DNA repair exonuclease SbcCD ATPase subunit